jgi:hypothetical protein
MVTFVRLLGLIALLAAVLASATYFPSIFGLVLLSAMLLGTPLLTAKYKAKPKEVSEPSLSKNLISS